MPGVVRVLGVSLVREEVWIVLLRKLLNSFFDVFELELVELAFVVTSESRGRSSDDAFVQNHFFGINILMQG
jgi:hypothetical protein